VNDIADACKDSHDGPSIGQAVYPSMTAHACTTDSLEARNMPSPLCMDNSWLIKEFTLYLQLSDVVVFAIF
jgi:hypothetical protein